MAPRILDETWDEEDWSHDDESGTVPCPYCRKEIPEDTPRCPYCENYLSEEDEARPPERKPAWIIIGVLICLYIVYRWVAG